MHNNLAKTLQKYYTRQGNRIIFSNGMTLNQIAFAMWESLGYSQIDASVISRVLQGKRTLTLDQLSCLAVILNLGTKQTSELFDSLSSDKAHKLGMLITGKINITDYTELIRLQLQKIKEIRIKGLPSIASDWAISLNETIRSKLPNIMDDKHKKELLLLLAQSLREQSRATGEGWSSKGGTETLKSLSRSLLDLSLDLKDKHIAGLAYFNLGDMYSLIGEFEKSSLYFIKSLKFLDNNTEEWLLAIRNVACDYAFNRNESEFEKLEGKINHEIGRFSSEHHSMVFEGFARAHAKLGLVNKAWKTYEKAEELYSSNNSATNKHKTLKKIQLARTKFEISLISKAKNMYPKLEKEGNEILVKCEEFGYMRYHDSFKNFLSAIKSY